MRFEGKQAIVTGGGQGLGRAYCLALAREGARLVVVDRNAEAARRVAGECGGGAIHLGLDVLDEAAVQDAFAGLDAQILINNAAIFSTLPPCPAEEIEAGLWRQVLAVQLDGALFCARAALPAMRRRGYGKIINVSSNMALMGRPLYLHYVTSKSGVVGLTRGLAKEWGAHGIRVNAVAPGAVETEVERLSMNEERWRAVVSGQALQRKAVPDDLIGPVLFLASAESDWMTGQLICVDGGMMLY